MNMNMYLKFIKSFVTTLAQGPPDHISLVHPLLAHLLLGQGVSGLCRLRHHHQDPAGDPRGREDAQGHLQRRPSPGVQLRASGAPGLHPVSDQPTPGDQSKILSMHRATSNSRQQKQCVYVTAKY